MIRDGHGIRARASEACTTVRLTATTTQNLPTILTVADGHTVALPERTNRAMRETLIFWQYRAPDGFGYQVFAYSQKIQTDKEDTQMTRKQIIEALKKAGIRFDKLGKNKNGNFTFRRSFFYTNGYSSHKAADRIREAIPAAKIIDCRDEWKSWPATSYFFVEFKA